MNRRFDRLAKKNGWPFPIPPKVPIVRQLKEVDVTIEGWREGDWVGSFRVPSQKD